MKNSARISKRFSGLLSLSLLLAPLAVFAQGTDFFVIPIVQRLKNVVTVSKSGGIFNDPVAAVKSIKDASAGNPYIVVIGPGIYTLTETLQMKEYVDIVGSGQNVTKLIGAISTEYDDYRSAVISGASNASLGLLTVENLGGGHYSVCFR